MKARSTGRRGNSNSSYILPGPKLNLTDMGRELKAGSSARTSPGPARSKARPSPRGAPPTGRAAAAPHDPGPGQRLAAEKGEPGREAAPGGQGGRAQEPRARPAPAGRATTRGPDRQAHGHGPRGGEGGPTAAAPGAEGAWGGGARRSRARPGPPPPPSSPGAGASPRTHRPAHGSPPGGGHRGQAPRARADGRPGPTGERRNAHVRGAAALRFRPAAAAAVRERPGRRATMASSHRAAPAGRKREGAALPGQRGGGGEERGLRLGLPAVQPPRRARLCREGRGVPLRRAGPVDKPRNGRRGPGRSFLTGRQQTAL